MKLRLFQLIVLFIMCIAFIFPYAGQFAFPTLSKYSDLVISHYPNLVFIRHSLQTWGEIPLWSDMIMGGYPFAADPLSGLWYFPMWILLILPLPFGFNLLMILHILWGTVGVYILLRSLNRSSMAAVIGSLAFLLMPKIFAHYGAGHITLVYAVCWTPWLLWLEEKTQQGSKRRLVQLAPGLVLGFIFLADVRWAIYSGLLYLAYSQYRYWASWVALRERTQKLWREVATFVARFLSRYLVVVLLAVMIAAPLLFPLAEFTRLSTRSALQAEDRLTLSIDPGQLLGLFFPDMAGYAEWVFYPGVLGIIAVLFVLLTQSTRRKNAFWLLALLFAILFALGPATPLAPFVSNIPIINLLRVPSRAMFIAGMAFCVLIASMVDELIRQYGNWQQRLKLALVGTIAFVDILAVGVWVVTRQLPLDFLWGAVMFTLIGLFMLVYMAKKISTTAWLIGLIPLLVLDLGGVSRSQIRFSPPGQVLADGEAVAQYLTARRDLNAPAGLFRIYSPSYSMPQQTAAQYDLQLVDGIDPLQLEAYSAFMAKASGVPRPGYSVTIPSFATGDTDIDNIHYQPDPDLLANLNVHFIVSNFTMEQTNLVLLSQFGNARVYGNSLARPRAWVQKNGALIDPAYTLVEQISESPNWVTVDAVGPGFVVLSEIDYPGWVATVDGKPIAIQKINGLLRSVSIDLGHHLVGFTYRPPLLYIGIVLALLGWVSLGVLLVLKRERIKGW